MWLYKFKIKREEVGRNSLIINLISEHYKINFKVFLSIKIIVYLEPLIQRYQKYVWWLKFPTCSWCWLSDWLFLVVFFLGFFTQYLSFWKMPNLTTNTNYMSEIAITKHISDIFESVSLMLKFCQKVYLGTLTCISKYFMANNESPKFRCCWLISFFSALKFDANQDFFCRIWYDNNQTCNVFQILID